MLKKANGDTVLSNKQFAAEESQTQKKDRNLKYSIPSFHCEQSVNMTEYKVSIQYTASFILSRYVSMASL